MEKKKPSSAQLEARIGELEGLLGRALERIAELETRLGMNSQTSSLPPSSDFPKPPRFLQKERETTRSSGGQVGHKGKTLKLSLNPDEVIHHTLEGYCGCGQAWGDPGVEGYEVRQVWEVPPTKLHIIEHRATHQKCRRCGHSGRAVFPVGVEGRVNYGPRARAGMTYLHQHQLLSLERTVETCADLLGFAPSEASVVAASQSAYGQLEPFERDLKSALGHSPVLGADETGYRQNGQTHWIHTLTRPDLVWYHCDPRRGKGALERMGVLNRYAGTLVHDAWSPYLALSCDHALCNAHLLRELRCVYELEGEIWARRYAGQLLEVKAQCEQARQHGVSELGSSALESLLTQASGHIQDGLTYHLQLDPLTRGARGKAKQRKGKNLLDRLELHAEAVWRFAHNFEVPFDNNQSERALRMVKLRQKVSGGFRGEGAKWFCRIRSYTTTLKKQALNVLEGLTSVFSRHPLLPKFSL